MPGLLRAVNHLINWKTHNLQNACFYYAQMVEQARSLVFYEKLEVPDTLEGRFDCLSLHMAMVLIAVKREGNPRFSQELFDLFFADVDRNLREMGVGDLSVGRQVKKLAQNFYGVLQAYEEGISQEKLLFESLTKNLYGGKSISQPVLKTLMIYMQASIELLSQLSLTETQVQIHWPELR